MSFLLALEALASLHACAVSFGALVGPGVTAALPVAVLLADEALVFRSGSSRGAVTSPASAAAARAAPAAASGARPAARAVDHDVFAQELLSASDERTRRDPRLS